MTTPDHPPIPADSARRRLLRNGFSVPAVLSLASGSALAATSSTCLLRATSTPSTAPLNNSTSLDRLVRVPLRQRDDNGHHIVSRDDLGGLKVSDRLWHLNVTWQRFGVNPNNLSNYNQLLYTPQTGPVPASTAVKLYVALRFDPQGYVVGMGLSGGGSVVGSSCWTSIVGPRPHA